MCISGCPYKKVYFNWFTGKSEKCILCYPRLETGQPPACFHACVGRIRYLGLILYDADRITWAISQPDDKLVEAQREVVLDPFDPQVIRAARANGVTDLMIEYAQRSPVYKFFKLWKVALPLHPEFRTLPMLFYVPPMQPVQAVQRNSLYETVDAGAEGLAPMLAALEKNRTPITYLASLFSAGNTAIIRDVYHKLIAVRSYMRYKKVGDVPLGEVQRALELGQTTPEECEAIWRLTSLPTFEERFVVPPLAREMAVENQFPELDPERRNYPTYRAEVGFGFRKGPSRRW